MALSIDISRALRTRWELHRLVEAIRDAPAGEPETDWVEWKTVFDLDNDVAHRFETAKHILGFGNRQTGEPRSLHAHPPSPHHLAPRCVTDFLSSRFECGIAVRTNQDRRAATRTSQDRGGGH